MEFVKIPREGSIPKSGENTVYLQVDRWNDFSFVTMFYMSIHDKNGSLHEIGNVKIGFKGQKESVLTHSILPDRFSNLDKWFFSLGQELEFYQKIREVFSKEVGDRILVGLQDICFIPAIFDEAKNENVFKTSLLRGVSLSVIKGQYRRVLDGGAPLTEFKFVYDRPAEEKLGGVKLSFSVNPESKPSTNIHAVIGRNGVGKTTLLNGMIGSIAKTKDGHEQYFYDENSLFQRQPISNDYFSSLVSVSFSAFDQFDPPPEQPDPSLGACYYYIGLKTLVDEKTLGGSILKSLDILREEFCSSIALCMSQPRKKDRWLKAITALESDENFADINLSSLAESMTHKELKDRSLQLITRMSSGHTVVLLITTKLVERVEEKTLVLIDEPESHLHPPLLSAFVRALSELLYDRNGVAIIATHSPVVLQEIPKSCVWKVTRSRLAVSAIRPEIQTFGENVGILTSEIFGLEVRKSGFHRILEDSVQKGSSFENIVSEYGGQLGFEAQAILRAMIHSRDGEG